MAVTTNYSFKKRKIGHPVRDDDVGDNLDMIDAAILAGVSPLLAARIIVGSAENLAVGVAMSGDISIGNTGVTAIGADKVLNTMLANITRGSIKVGGAADAPTDLAAKADAQMLIGDGTDIASVEITGDVTVDNAGVTAIGANKVVIAKVEAALQKSISMLSLSFETDEQTTTKIYFPMKVTINKIRSIVMKALAATNVGTITGANSVGASNNGVVTIAASAALNEEDSASPDSNNVVAADSYYQLTTAKAAAGGKVLATLEYTRTA